MLKAILDLRKTKIKVNFKKRSLFTIIQEVQSFYFLVTASQAINKNISKNYTNKHNHEFACILICAPLLAC